MKSTEFFLLPSGVLLIILALFTFLRSKRNKTNQFHLDYILAHFIILILMVLLYLLFGLFSKTPAAFSLAVFLHILSIVAFALHVESAIKGYKAKLTYLYAIPILAYILVSILNVFDLYLLDYATDKTFFLNLQIEDTLYFSDKILAKNFAFGFVLVRIIFISFKSIDKSPTVKKKSLYKVWIYTYCLITGFMHLFTTLYYFNFAGDSFDWIFTVLTKLATVLNLLFILANPRILYYLPRISEIAIFTKVKKENYFEIINSMVEQEMLYLNTGLTINKLAVKTGISAKNIRASILVATTKNYTDYINHFRVQKAAALLKENYLSKHTTVALSEKSGFKSHQSFFRAFKKVYRTTPALYAKKISADLK